MLSFKKRLSLMLLGLSTLASPSLDSSELGVLPQLCTKSDVCDESAKSMMYEQLDTIKSIFEVKYAPFLWKNEYAGWSIDEEIQRAKERISESEDLTVKAYQRILKDLFNSAKDYHVNIGFYSTEMAMLPFRVKGVNGKYFVVSGDPQWLGNPAIPLDLGDEILTFDGEPIAEIIERIKEEEERHSTDLTDQLMAETFFTLRVGAMGADVPKGFALITFRDGQNGMIRSFSTPWLYQEEMIHNHGRFNGGEEHAFFQQPEFPQEKDFKTMFTEWVCGRPYHWDGYKYLNQGLDRCMNGDPFRIGARKSFIPDLGIKIFQTSEQFPFYAYKFVGEDRKIYGYIRIPTYMAEESWVDAFAQMIYDFQQSTNALIIDQVNNPGGMIFYMSSLLSMLTDRPLELPYEQVKLYQEDVMQAAKMMADLERVRSDHDAKSLFGPIFMGHIVNMEFARSWLEHFRFLINEWNEGRTLSNKFQGIVGGIEKVMPHPTVRYTKPIIVLINEGAISCGDFFPAVMQDNKRAVLFGSGTSGAGGSVGTHTLPNFFGIKDFTLTQSLLERQIGIPIENLGVQPDISYEITEKDVRYNFYKYKNAVLDLLGEVMKQ